MTFKTFHKGFSENSCHLCCTRNDLIIYQVNCIRTEQAADHIRLLVAFPFHFPHFPNSDSQVQKHTMFGIVWIKIDKRMMWAMIFHMGSL